VKIYQTTKISASKSHKLTVGLISIYCTAISVLWTSMRHSSGSSLAVSRRISTHSSDADDSDSSSRSKEMQTSFGAKRLKTMADNFTTQQQTLDRLSTDTPVQRKNYDTHLSVCC